MEAVTKGRDGRIKAFTCSEREKVKKKREKPKRRNVAEEIFGTEGEVLFFSGSSWA